MLFVMPLGLWLLEASRLKIPASVTTIVSILMWLSWFSCSLPELIFHIIIRLSRVISVAI